MYNEIHLNKIDIAGGPPAEEPARQYYFMAKCQDWVREFEQKKGRRPTAFIQTFGCQMNARDSEKLLGILEEAGFVQGADENSDFVLYNTCTVRENANLKVYGRLGYLGGLKRKNPDMLIALCGCMMQEPQVVEKIRKSYRFVDIIFGTHNIFKLAELIFRPPDRKKDGGGHLGGHRRRSWRSCPVERKYPFKSGVNIMFGCNNFCSYCIVPYVRGRERSRNPEDIIQEIEEPGGRRRGGGDASGAERQFLWKDTGEAHHLCGASAAGGADRRTGADPVYDFPSQGSCRMN